MNTLILVGCALIWLAFAFLLGYAKGQVDAEREAVDR